MKRLKKALIIAGPVVVVAAVLAVIASFQSQDVLTTEEKKQIEAFNFLADDGSNSTPNETSAIIPVEDEVTSTLLEEDEGDGDTGETNNNADRIVVTPITEQKKPVVSPKPIVKPNPTPKPPDVKPTPIKPEVPNPEPEQPKPEPPKTDPEQPTPVNPGPQQPEPVDPPPADNGDGDNGGTDPYENIR